jgi:hypothetical protein
LESVPHKPVVMIGFRGDLMVVLVEIEQRVQ